jgi:hypothetical protein
MPRAAARSPSPPADPAERIRAAVLAASSAIMARRITVEDGLRLVMAEMGGAEMSDITPREAVAETRRQRKRAMLDEMARLEADGKAVSAATLTAKKFAEDPHDATEIESLARSLRRWSRK